ncbi:hypothetical protein BaRGS_00039361, partial [Batillaria attramentaria]
ETESNITAAIDQSANHVTCIPKSPHIDHRHHLVKCEHYNLTQRFGDTCFAQESCDGFDPNIWSSEMCRRRSRDSGGEVFIVDTSTTMADQRLTVVLTLVLLGGAVAKPSAELHREKRQSTTSCFRQLEEWEPAGYISSSDCQGDASLYPNSADWTYKILTDHSSCHTVHLDFHVKEIEGPADSCPYDHLEIVGQSGTICGSNNYVSRQVDVQPGGSVEIRFTSDYSVQGEGFEISYWVDTVPCDGYNPTASSSYWYTSSTTNYWSTNWYYPSSTSDYNWYYPSSTSDYNWYSTSSYYGGPVDTAYTEPPYYYDQEWENYGYVSSSECGGSPYPNNADWTYKINTSYESCHRVNVYLYVTEIEGPPEQCPYDYLQIVGQTDKICGNNTYVDKQVDVQPGEPVEIRFISDGSVQGEGYYFAFWVETIPCDEWENYGYVESSECGGSPYPNNADWTYKINTGYESCHRVNVYLSVTEIEGPPEQCPYDYLQIVGQTDKICGNDPYVDKQVDVQPGEPVEIRYTSEYNWHTSEYNWHTPSYTSDNYWHPTSSYYGRPLDTGYYYPSTTAYPETGYYNDQGYYPSATAYRETGYYNDQDYYSNSYNDNAYIRLASLLYSLKSEARELASQLNEVLLAIDDAENSLSNVNGFDYTALGGR